MISLILAAFLAATPSSTCYTVEVCSTPATQVTREIKPKAKPAPKRKPLVKKESAPAERLIVVKEKTVIKEKVVYKDATPKKDAGPFLVIGPRAALGYGLQVGPGPADPSGLVGVRAHIPSLHLGLDAYIAFDYGVGVQGLVYPYQGDRLNVHLNAGVIGFTGDDLSVSDVPRPWDLTLGAGVEYKLIKNLSVTFDSRWALPSPFKMADKANPVYDANGNQVYGPMGRYLDVGHVLGNSFAQQQFLLGLMVHN